MGTTGTTGADSPNPLDPSLYPSLSAASKGILSLASASASSTLHVGLIVLPTPSHLFAFMQEATAAFNAAGQDFTSSPAGGISVAGCSLYFRYNTKALNLEDSFHPTGFFYGAEQPAYAAGKYASLKSQALAVYP